jgi:hypothetical protein
MELNELKDIWKKHNEGFQPKDKTELASMLKGKSTSIISRLKRNVWFELIFTFLGGLGLLIYALMLPAGYLKWSAVSILVFFGIYSFYYVKKLQLLNRFDSTNDHIKANLERLIHNLNGYLKFYKRSYSILYPVYFFLGLLFAAIERGASQFLNNLSRPDVYITLLLGAAAFFIVSRWLTLWYLKKLYGNHLQKLEDLLQDLYATDKAD